MFLIGAVIRFTVFCSSCSSQIPFPLDLKDLFSCKILLMKFKMKQNIFKKLFELHIMYVVAWSA